MIKEIDIPEENDVVEIDEKYSSITVSGRGLKQWAYFDKSLSIEKKGRKLILKIPSDDEKSQKILDSTIKEINKLFKKCLYPYFIESYGWVAFDCEVSDGSTSVGEKKVGLSVAFDNRYSMELCCSNVVNQLLSDGFIFEPSTYRYLIGSEREEIIKSELVLDAKSSDIYMRPSHGNNPVDIIEKMLRIEYMDRQEKFNVSYLGIKGNWEQFTYFKDKIVPICQQTPNKIINLGAWAPPDYKEKPYYYPLIQFLYYPDGTVKDITVYCTRNNEYKEEKGFKRQILNKKFENWDEEWPSFVSDGGVHFKGKSFIVGAFTYPPWMIVSYANCENENALNKIVGMVSQRLLNDGFTLKSLRGFKMEGDTMMYKDLGKDKIISGDALFTRSSEEISLSLEDEYYTHLTGFYKYTLTFVADWNGHLFSYLRDAVVPSCLLGKAPVALMAWAPPNYKERPLYYPLIDIIFCPDGRIIDRTVYVTKKNEYKDEIGFKQEIIERKFRRRRKSK